MRHCVILAAFVLGVFFAFPLIMEGTTGECVALSQKAIESIRDEKSNVAGSAFATGIGSFVLSAAVSVRYPNVPPGVACAWIYWRATVNPPGTPIFQ